MIILYALYDLYVVSIQQVLLLVSFARNMVCKFYKTMPITTQKMRKVRNKVTIINSNQTLG